MGFKFLGAIQETIHHHLPMRVEFLILLLPHRRVTNGRDAAYRKHTRVAEHEIVDSCVVLVRSATTVVDTDEPPQRPLLDRQCHRGLHDQMPSVHIEWRIGKFAFRNVLDQQPGLLGVVLKFLLDGARDSSSICGRSKRPFRRPAPSAPDGGEGGGYRSWLLPSQTIV